MNDLAETLRQRAERMYKFGITDQPKLLAAEMGDMAALSSLSEWERLEIPLVATQAVRLALFDLAEQLDSLLGLKPQAEE